MKHKSNCSTIGGGGAGLDGLDPSGRVLASLDELEKLIYGNERRSLVVERMGPDLLVVLDTRVEQELNFALGIVHNREGSDGASLNTEDVLDVVGEAQLCILKLAANRLHIGVRIGKRGQKVQIFLLVLQEQILQLCTLLIADEFHHRVDGHDCLMTLSRFAID